MPRSLDPEKLKLENRTLRSENRKLRRQERELRERLLALNQRVETLQRSQAEIAAASAQTDELLRWLKARLQIVEREIDRG